MTNTALTFCPVCGGSEFTAAQVLWPDLINAWQLSEYEVKYIDRQQGYHCDRCYSNLRTMGLAATIMREYGFTGTFDAFCQPNRSLRILEINRAGLLTPFLSRLPEHRLVEYPEFDMMDLEVSSNYYDLVLHSDTLEHIPFPVKGLAECKRVLAATGVCIFTVPIVVDRMTRSRQGLAGSFHGEAYVNARDQLVHTEFGADFWKWVINAGFLSCEVFAYEYPSALAITARK